MQHSDAAVELGCPIADWRQTAVLYYEYHLHYYYYYHHHFISYNFDLSQIIIDGHDN